MTGATIHRLTIASLPCMIVAFSMLWWQIATGWHPFWYDWTVAILLLCNLALQALALYYARWHA